MKRKIYINIKFTVNGTAGNVVLLLILKYLHDLLHKNKIVNHIFRNIIHN